MKQSQVNYKRIVIKIGSSLLYAKETQSACFSFPLENIGNEISNLTKEGKEVIVVSSGAIAAGMRALKIKSRPRGISSLQATAAVGQHLLMGQYRRFFENKGINCAQILLTWEDFDDRKRQINARNTLLALLKLKCIPVINENDTVATEEIRFGDNDQLSARVASLVAADLLIILSDVDGLLNREKQVIPVVEQITPEIKGLACPTDKATCVGGMITKIDAAKIVVDSGIPCIIANGNRHNIISSVIGEPEKYGSLFLPKKKYMALRKRWIVFGAKPKGKIIVDDGAKKALLNRKSLLSVGVLGIAGNFENADVVSIVDKAGHEFARGKVAVPSSQLKEIKGMRSDKEVVHCDNIVVTG